MAKSVFVEYVKVEIEDYVEGIGKMMAENRPVPHVRRQLQGLADLVDYNEDVLKSGRALDWAKAQVADMTAQVLQYERDRQSVEVVPKTKKVKKKPKSLDASESSAINAEEEMLAEMVKNLQLVKKKKKKKVSIPEPEEPKEQQVSQYERDVQSVEVVPKTKKVKKKPKSLDTSETIEKSSSITAEEDMLAEMVKKSQLSKKKKVPVAKPEEPKEPQVSQYERDVQSVEFVPKTKKVKKKPGSLDASESSAITAEEEMLADMVKKTQLSKKKKVSFDEPEVTQSLTPIQMPSDGTDLKEEVKRYVHKISGLMKSGKTRKAVLKEMTNLAQFIEANILHSDDSELRKWTRREYNDIKHAVKEYKPRTVVPKDIVESGTHSTTEEMSVKPKLPKKRPDTSKKPRSDPIERRPILPREPMMALDEPTRPLPLPAPPSLSEQINTLKQEIRDRLKIFNHMLAEKVSVDRLRKEWKDFEDFLSKKTLIKDNYHMRQWVDDETRNTRAAVMYVTVPNVPMAKFKPIENLYDWMGELEQDESQKHNRQDVGMRRWKKRLYGEEQDEEEQDEEEEDDEGQDEEGKFPKYPYGCHKNQDGTVGAIQGPPDVHQIYTKTDHFGDDREEAIEWPEEGLKIEELDYKLENIIPTGEPDLGEGSYGFVIGVTADESKLVNGRWTQPKRLNLACKVVCFRDPNDPEEEREDCRRLVNEMNYCRLFKHDNIVLGYGALGLPDSQTGYPYANIILLMERIDANLLDDLFIVQYKEDWTCDLVKVWVRQVLKGYEYLHEVHSVRHNDPHLGNFFVKFGTIQDTPGQTRPITRTDTLADIVHYSTFKIGDFGQALDIVGTPDEKLKWFSREIAGFVKEMNEYLENDLELEPDQGMEEFIEAMHKDNKPLVRDALNHPWLKE